MNRDAPVGFHHDQPIGFGQMGREPARIVDRTAGNDEAHGAIVAGAPGLAVNYGCRALRMRF